MTTIILLATLALDVEINQPKNESADFEFQWKSGETVRVEALYGEPDAWVITRARKVKMLPCGGPWVCEPDGDGMVCECKGPLLSREREPDPKIESSKVHIGPGETKCGPAGDGCNTSCCNESGFCNTTTMACPPGTKFEMKP